MNRINGDIDILKIDFEGAEIEIFVAENVEWLHRVKVIIIEFHDREIKGCSEVLYRYLIENNIFLHKK